MGQHLLVFGVICTRRMVGARMLPHNELCWDSSELISGSGCLRAPTSRQWKVAQMKHRTAAAGAIRGPAFAGFLA